MKTFSVHVFFPFPASVKGICLFTGTVTSHLLFPLLRVQYCRLHGSLGAPDRKYFPNSVAICLFGHGATAQFRTQNISPSEFLFFNVVVDNTSGLSTQLYVAVHIGKHIVRYHNYCLIAKINAKEMLRLAIDAVLGGFCILNNAQIC
jgi:hypothetical protein